MASVLEWLGCLSGLLGAALLALNNRYSGYGFAAFLISNVCWISYGVLSGSWGLVVMQMGFTATSLLGLYRWFPELRQVMIRRVN